MLLRLVVQRLSDPPGPAVGIVGTTTTVNSHHLDLVALLLQLLLDVGETLVVVQDLLRIDAGVLHGLGADQQLVLECHLFADSLHQCVRVTHHRLQFADGLAKVPDLGFDGITVSILAGNNPIGVLPAAFLFGLLKGGALEIGFQTDVPTELVGVLRGLIILFVAMPEFFRMIGRYAGMGSGGTGGVASTASEADEAAGTEGGEADA